MPTYPFPTPLPVIPNVMKVLIKGVAGGRTIGNDIAFRGSALDPDPDPGVMANRIAVHWQGVITSLLNPEYTGVSVTVYDLSTAGASPAEAPMTGTGGDTGTHLPYSTCIEVRHITGVRKKSGKTYISPTTTGFSDSSNNGLTSGGKAAVQVVWDAFVNSVLADAMWGPHGAAFGVISLITAKAWDPRFLPATSSVVQQPYASQNRRRPGR